MWSACFVSAFNFLLFVGSLFHDLSSFNYFTIPCVAHTTYLTYIICITLIMIIDVHMHSQHSAVRSTQKSNDTVKYTFSRIIYRHFIFVLIKICFDCIMFLVCARVCQRIFLLFWSKTYYSILFMCITLAMMAMVAMKLRIQATHWITYFM